MQDYSILGLYDGILNTGASMYVDAEQENSKARNGEPS